MNRKQIPIIAFVIGLLVTEVTSFAETYDKSMTPKILSEWVSSTDGKVSICLTVNKTTFSPSERIIIRCALRNNTDKALVILRPFGDDFYTLSAGLHILGPDGPLDYYGAMKEYVLGTSAFYELRPGMVIDETLEIPKQNFKGLGELGLYKIKYTYQSSGYPEKPKPANFWAGAIEADVVHVLVMNKTPNQKLDPTVKTPVESGNEQGTAGQL